VSAETIVLVRAAVAPLHAEPKAASEQVSQSVAGQLAVILEAREGWRRVRLADGYEGWMHEGYLDAHALSAEAAHDWAMNARHSVGCTVYDDVTDMERALPLGARVASDDNPASTTRAAVSVFFFTVISPSSWTAPPGTSGATPSACLPSSR